MLQAYFSLLNPFKNFNGCDAICLSRRLSFWHYFDNHLATSLELPQSSVTFILYTGYWLTFSPGLPGPPIGPGLPTSPFCPGAPGFPGPPLAPYACLREMSWREGESGKGGGEEEGGEGVKGGGGRRRRKQEIGGGLERGVQMTENCRTFRIQKENVLWIQCINHVKVDN